MPAATDRLEFAPLPAPGMLRSFGLAVLAHLLLAAALTWGVNWKRQTENLAVEAELWGPVTQQAAPKAVEPPPAPTPKAVAEPPKPQPIEREAAIALEKQKKKLEQDKIEKDKLEKDRLKREQDKKAALDKKAQDAVKTKADEKALEEQRKKNLARIAGMADATGGAEAKGNAQQSTAISATYAGRIKAKIRPNIIASDDFPTSLKSEFLVYTSPDGTIVGTPKLSKSSGNPKWDERAQRAIIATQTLPRDESGRVPSPMEIVVSPRD